MAEGGDQTDMKLLLIDGHSILNRAFFGLPDLTNSTGLHTNAVYGFLNILFKFLETEQPDYLTVAFDVHAPTFRHKMYAEYKGTRKPMAPELRQQVPMIKEMLRAMGVTIVEQEGYEADDILGTIAGRAQAAGADVTIVSGDRDLLQLATEHVKISIPKTKKTGTEIEHYYAADVKERYQVTPQQFIDVKALWGDTADNIPGVPGIGEKTATAIIAQYGSLEEAHAHAAELKPPRASKNLMEYYEQALLSKTLATIETDCEIAYDLEQAKLLDLFTPEAYELCRAWEFKNFLSRFSVDTPGTFAEDFFVRETDAANIGELFQQWGQMPDAAFGVFAAADRQQEGYVLTAVAVARESEAYFFPVQGDVTAAYLKEQVRGLAESTGILCAGDLKLLWKQLEMELPNDAAGLFDADVAAYLLNPLKNSYPTEDLAREFLGVDVPSHQETFAKKTYARAWEDAQTSESAQMSEDAQAFFRFCCYQAWVPVAAREKMLAQLDAEGMLDLYRETELPLVIVLAAMEQAGIAMDKHALEEYGERLTVRIRELEQVIYQQAGEQFNINSPKQLGTILFEKLQMQGGKKTKTGYSTAADVLERLAPDYPIVADILEYRQLAKLKSTYADGLGHCLCADGRVHSTFQQTVTATGRLSSTEPNLQNIPIRMELGKLIRKVFYPGEGCVFVDADYSQIELRVLAHMSGDEHLISAYRQNQDIHRSTASLVFHTPFDEVTDLQRRNAKAVNFGIVYGISAFGLSQDLSITKKEAQKYIDDYFLAYPRMKEFIDTLVAQGKEQGYVTTMYGRKRPIPELSSSNFMQRSFGERVAMNSPVQGTAADIIKIAMVRVFFRLQREHLQSRLILQVHDELLIEAREEELSQVKQILAEEMEQAAALAVPLEIDMHAGKNWYDAK